jgi:hypothetical protein
MEANNGCEYRIVKVRAWLGSRERAADRATARAAADGWEAVNGYELPGPLRTSALVLRRRVAEEPHPADR